MTSTSLKHLLALLLATLHIIGSPNYAFAFAGWQSSNLNTNTIQTIAQPNKIQEVEAPGATKQIRKKLLNHNPNLRLISPEDKQPTNDENVELVIAVDDWPLVNDPELGLGPHIAIAIDDYPLQRITNLNDGKARIPLRALRPGTHRFSAWAAYPWGEAVTSLGGTIQGRVHIWQKLYGTQPEINSPWLLAIPPSDEQNHQPLMLDWQILNAPLQKLKEDDLKWLLRVSVDGESFLVDHHEAVWLKSSEKENLLVQMELLDGNGDPLDPIFNNKLVILKKINSNIPAWMKNNLTEDELQRLSGEKIIEKQSKTILKKPFEDLIDKPQEVKSDEYSKDSSNIPEEITSGDTNIKETVDSAAAEKKSEIFESHEPNN